MFFYIINMYIVIRTDIFFAYSVAVFEIFALSFMTYFQFVHVYPVEEVIKCILNI